MFKSIRHYLLGKTLAIRETAEEKLTNFQALAIFGSDALSSTAYATEEILLVLALAGAMASSHLLPISLAIALLILMVAFSYREIIYAYPQGGGVYNVAKENLGETPGLIGASSLVFDYILTVTVSVAAGVAAITSAFPSLYPYRILMGLLVILFLMWINLKGVRSSGRIFSLPTYIFIATILGLLIIGIIRVIFGILPKAAILTDVTATALPLQALSLLLILRAFSSGCAALTGIEATSNGVRAFKEPETKNAGKILLRLAILLIFIFLGIGFLSSQVGLVPAQSETILSQVAKIVFGKTPFYFLTQIATFLILFLAANTPYAGFPRMVALQAQDGYWPKQFSLLGSRLVFSNGIVALSIVSAILLLLFKGNVHTLIPMYAVGVFLGFSLSQLGMIFYWKKQGFGKHLKSVMINFIGFIATGTVFMVVLFSKFIYGAWILLPTILILLFVMKKIKKHYQNVEKILSLEETEFLRVLPEKIMMIVFVSKLNRLAIETALFARGFKPGEIKAFHIAFDEKEATELKNEWEIRFSEIPMDIVIDEFREIIPHALNYIRNMEKQWKESGGEKVIAVIPMVVPTSIFDNFLHNKTAEELANAIRKDPENNAEILENYIKVH
ncbi:MAG: APC family permease [Candidatus Nealsonbacteria bacterium]|nr:APC family permease [Candidatus Nealsonbacteria bacterium]